MHALFYYTTSQLNCTLRQNYQLGYARLAIVLIQSRKSAYFYVQLKKKYKSEKSDIIVMSRHINIPVVLQHLRLQSSIFSVFTNYHTDFLRIR